MIAPPSPVCAAGQVVPTLVARGNDADGGPRSGVLLVLRNFGTAACRIPGLPRLSFTDAEGGVLPIVVRPPPGFHPGPVVLPVVVAPGAEATAGLRWVSRDVFAPGRCFAPRSITVTFGTSVLTRPFTGVICGPATRPATFDQSWLTAGPPRGR